MKTLKNPHNNYSTKFKYKKHITLTSFPRSCMVKPRNMLKQVTNNKGRVTNIRSNYLMSKITARAIHLNYNC